MIRVSKLFISALVFQVIIAKFEIYRISWDDQNYFWILKQNNLDLSNMGCTISEDDFIANFYNRNNSLKLKNYSYFFQENEKNKKEEEITVPNKFDDIENLDIEKMLELSEEDENKKKSIAIPACVLYMHINDKKRIFAKPDQDQEFTFEAEIIPTEIPEKIQYDDQIFYLLIPQINIFIDSPGFMVSEKSLDSDCLQQSNNDGEYVYFSYNEVKSEGNLPISKLSKEAFFQVNRNSIESLKKSPVLKNQNNIEIFEKKVDFKNLPVVRCPCENKDRRVLLKLDGKNRRRSRRLLI